MSSSLVAANPRSAKTSRAALMISSGRASLRRRHRGRTRRRLGLRGLRVAVPGISAPKLLTERSVSNFGFPPPSSPPTIIENEISAGRRGAQLPQERYDLTTVIRGMVDEMTKHLPEAVHVLPTAGGFYEPSVVQTGVGERRDKSPPLRFDFLPAGAHIRQRTKVRALRCSRVRSS